MASDEAQVFIARLPRDTRPEDLEAVFTKYGKLARCDVRSGGVHCYAFVSYEDKRDAEDAVRAEDGRDFRGNRIAVEFAKTDRGGGGGRGGRGRYGGGGGRYGGGGYGGGRDRSPAYRRGRSRSRSRTPPRRSRRSPSYSRHSRSPRSPRRRDREAPKRERSASPSRSRSRS